MISPQRHGRMAVGGNVNTTVTNLGSITGTGGHVTFGVNPANMKITVEA